MKHREAAKKLTFHSCLLQVVQNRTEDLTEFPKAFRHGVKQSGKKFAGEIDKFLGHVYPACNDEEIQQGMELINLIADKVDEAYEIYQKELGDESQTTTSESSGGGTNSRDSQG